MTGRPTATERAAIKAGYAALLQSESPNSNIVETVVFGLGDRQMLMSPETADELRQLRERVAELAAAQAGEPRATDGAVAALADAVQAAEGACDVCGDPPSTWCQYCAACRCAKGHDGDCPKAESPAAYAASRLVGMDDVTGVTVDDDTTVTVQVTPRDLDGWRWWLGRFQVPVHTITCRGLVTTAKGTAPGGVTVLIVGHGIAALQAAAVSYITQRGGESR